MAERAGGVLSVELDRRLAPLHRDVFGCHPGIRFVYEDALRMDLATAARREADSRGLDRLVLTGNLPFQITSPLLFAQCRPGVPWTRMTVMVQREVADRITANPRCKAYGILTVKLANWWLVKDRFEVPAACFSPRPQVDATVLTFEPLASERTPPPHPGPACPFSSTPPLGSGARCWSIVWPVGGMPFPARRPVELPSVDRGWPRPSAPRNSALIN